MDATFFPNVQRNLLRFVGYGTPFMLHSPWLNMCMVFVGETAHMNTPVTQKGTKATSTQNHKTFKDSCFVPLSIPPGHQKKLSVSSVLFFVDGKVPLDIFFAGVSFFCRWFSAHRHVDFHKRLFSFVPPWFKKNKTKKITLTQTKTNMNFRPDIL
jgi:hypothetical protein